MRVAVHAILHFEPVHCPSLAVEKHIKTSLNLVFGDENRTTSFVRLTNKVFRSCSKKDIFNAEHALKFLCMILASVWAKDWVSKKRSSQGFTGLLDRDRINCMLEASEFDSIDRVSSFWCGLIDSLCELTRTSETIGSLTKFVERGRCLVWVSLDF